MISELILLELYGLLRNQVVLAKPLSASDAVDVCESFREHPLWQVVLPVLAVLHQFRVRQVGLLPERADVDVDGFQNAWPEVHEFVRHMGRPEDDVAFFRFYGLQR